MRWSAGFYRGIRMSSELVLRLSDALLALFFAWLLVISLSAGRIGGQNGFKFNRTERPGQYWPGIFLLALMVLHFGGLAWVGQTLG